jgi:hypothetical protein
MFLRLLAPVIALLAGCHFCPAQLVGLPPGVDLSDQGRALIYEFEVGGGERYYNRFLIRPEWPGFASGVTWGVGYDGGYNSPAVIRHDWRALDGVDLGRLAATSGITGARAKAKLASVRDIVVAWGLAEGVFNEVTVARFAAMARRIFPGFDDLRPNAQAALLSLTFNRGDSLAGPRRVEMRAIVPMVPRRDYAGMAGQIRHMIPIWAGTEIYAGMKRRRLAEAALMETP